MRYSYKNLIETSDIPLLVRGGPSSSETLNKINENIRTDIARLNMAVQEQERRQRMVAAYLDQQVTGIQGLVNYLESIIPAASTKAALIDFYSTGGVHSSNTATIDEDYGQATLPVTSVQEKMYYTDQNGKVWIPEDSRLRFFTSSTYVENAIPDDSLFQASTEDFRGIHGTPDNFFLGGYLPTETYLYVKAVLPATLNTHRLSNRITVHPIPAFSHKLVGVYIRQTNGIWKYQTKSYLPGFSSSSKEVLRCGPFRMHFSPTEISEVCLVFKTNQWWGFQEFSIQLVEYNTSADLVVDFSSYSPQSLETIILYGKDRATLNSLGYNVDGSVVTVPISQTASYTTPVITGIEARWA